MKVVLMQSWWSNCLGITVKSISEKGTNRKKYSLILNSLLKLIWRGSGPTYKKIHRVRSIIKLWIDFWLDRKWTQKMAKPLSKISTWHDLMIGSYQFHRMLKKYFLSCISRHISMRFNSWWVKMVLMIISWRVELSLWTRYWCSGEMWDGERWDEELEFVITALDD